MKKSSASSRKMKAGTPGHKVREREREKQGLNICHCFCVKLHRCVYVCLFVVYRDICCIQVL